MQGRRIRWLEAELERFDPQEVADVGARVRGAIGDINACDPYERALTITLDVLEHRRAHDVVYINGRHPAWRIVASTSGWDLPAAAALTGSCLACHLTHTIDQLHFEPAA